MGDVVEQTELTGIPVPEFGDPERLFAGIKAWNGRIQKGRHRNFLGALHPIDSWEHAEGFPDEFVIQETRIPTTAQGEGYFEWASTLMAVRAARDRFTMVSLGAHYGGPLVDAALALKHVNPMPCFLVGAEADPYMCEMLYEHFRENGLIPANHWIINCAVNDTNRPVVFPVCEIRTGANTTLHDPRQREALFNTINGAGKSEETLKNILIDASTHLYTQLARGPGVPEARGELRLISAVRVADIFGPLQYVDYLEIDMQQAEQWALPPAMTILRNKVRLIHLGTHGTELHHDMANSFAQQGWKLLANLTPGTNYETPGGSFKTSDGVLIMLNPALEGGLPQT